MIRVEHLNKSFGTLQVLKDINLSIGKGEVVSIVGASGAGKTTLLQILGTLMRPDSGHIFYEDADVTGLNEKALSRFRNQNVGFVFQFHNLLPEFTALENVCMPALIAGKKMEEATAEAMKLLVNHPAAILADEPSGNLDTHHAEELHDLFFQLRDQYRQTFVIVTHNTGLAQKSDRQILLRDGMVVD